MINRPAVRVAALALLGLTAACTSSGPPDDASSPAPMTSTSTATSSSVPPSATTSAPTSPAASGLSAVDGSYVLAGSSADDALLYRVTAGRVVKASTATGITGVSVDDTTVVVGRETADAELVQQLRGGRLVSLGIESGFGPAVSDDGALAWASLGASTTPGISKPGGSVLRVRSSVTGTDRVLARFPGSISAPVWTDDDLVVAVADGDDGSARIVRFVDGRGSARTVARVADADALELTGGDDAVTVATDGGAKVVTLRGGTRSFARGWQPLCWADDDSVLASRGDQLATVPVSADGTAGTPRTLGRLPAGAQAFGGACGD